MPNAWLGFYFAYSVIGTAGAPEGMTLVNPMTKIPREARMINTIKMIYATLCFLEHAFSDVKSKTNPTRFITSDTPPKMVKNQPFNVFIILMRTPFE